MSRFKTQPLLLKRHGVVVRQGNFLIGYRSDEVNLKVTEVPDATCFVLRKLFTRYDPSVRPPMSASYVQTIPAILPKPDVTHPYSLLDGIAKRMAYSPPKYDRNERKRFRKFVRKWLKKNLTPIDETDDLDFDEWLESTPYEAWRKEEIKKAYPIDCFVNGEVDVKKFKNFKVKIFTKEEYYPEFKHFRGIWARSDEAKCILGPFFRRIEKQLFSLPYFIKKIPKNDRPEYINKFMNNAYLRFQSTDYTSYESHFTTDMMDDCEFELYRYMSSNNVKAKMLTRLIFKILASTNVADNNYFSVKVDAKRMSGEMNTSLGNGFSNLMFLLYAVEKYKFDHSGPIVEGDDAVIGLNEPIPKDYYIKMGLNVKMQFVDNISEASFCGLVYDSLDLINIREPLECLCTTPWVTKKYASCTKSVYYSLIKSKALSLMYEYPGCPIVYNYGRKIFDLLSEFKIKSAQTTPYQKALFLKAFQAYKCDNIPFKETGQSTRLLMEKVFNIPVSLQFRIEKEIEYMTIDNFNIPSALEAMPGIWIDNYNSYVLRSQDQDWNNICRQDYLTYSKLDIDRIIQTEKEIFKIDKPIEKSLFYMNKKNKDNKFYDDYIIRWNDSHTRLRVNNLKI